MTHDPVGEAIKKASVSTKTSGHGESDPVINITWGTEDEARLILNAAKTWHTQQQGDGWFDISMAPKDGTEIFLWDGQQIFIGCWRDNPYGNGNSGWSIKTDCTYVWCDGSPTHWRPLPLPPKGNE